MSRARLTPAEFYRWIFNEQPPPYMPFYPGAIFGIHRHTILARRRPFYERLLGYFEGLGHANPEEAHYMERFWIAIFDPDWAKRAESIHT
jgi:hypothetical protein